MSELWYWYLAPGALIAPTLLVLTAMRCGPGPTTAMITWLIVIWLTWPAWVVIVLYGMVRYEDGDEQGTGTDCT